LISFLTRNQLISFLASETNPFLATSYFKPKSSSSNDIPPLPTTSPRLPSAHIFPSTHNASKKKEISCPTGPRLSSPDKALARSGSLGRKVHVYVNDGSTSKDDDGDISESDHGSLMFSHKKGPTSPSGTFNRPRLTMHHHHDHHHAPSPLTMNSTFRRPDSSA